MFESQGVRCSYGCWQFGAYATLYTSTAIQSAFNISSGWIDKSSYSQKTTESNCHPKSDANAVATRVIHEPGSAAADVGVVGDARSKTMAGMGQMSESTQAGRAVV